MNLRSTLNRVGRIPLWIIGIAAMRAFGQAPIQPAKPREIPSSLCAPPQVSILAFGAKCDGKTDDSDAFRRALAYATLVARPLRLCGNLSLSHLSAKLDVGRTALVGPCIIEYHGPSATGAFLTLVGSTEYAQLDRQTRTVLQDLTFRGDPSANAIQIGDGHGEAAAFDCENIAVKGFKDGILFADHSWRVAFRNLRLVGCALATPQFTTDFGESMELSNCFFADGAIVTLNRGSWRLINCSFDNAMLQVNNDAIVNLLGPHFENPGGQTAQPLFLDLGSGASSVTIDGGELVLDRRVGGITDGVFRTCSAVPVRLHGMTFVQYGFFDPRRGGDDYRSLFRNDGKGTVDASASNVLAFDNAQYFGIGNGNALANGNFSRPLANGWDASTGARIDHDGYVGKRVHGDRALRLTVGPSQPACTVSQVVPAGADIMNLQGFAKTVGCHLQISVVGEAMQGSVVAKLGHVEVASAEYQPFCISFQLGDGVARIRISFTAMYDGGNGVAHVADCICSRL